MRKRIEKILWDISIQIMTMICEMIRHFPYVLTICLKQIFTYTVRRVLKRKEKIIHKNLKIVYGDTKTEQDRNTFIKEYEKTMIRNCVDVATTIICKRKQNEVLGLENYNKAIKKGRGVLYLSFHTNHFIFTPYIVRPYIHLHFLLRKHKKNKVESDLFIHFLSNHLGHGVIITDDHSQAIKNMIHVIRNKSSIAFLFDHNFKDNPTYVDFFGKKASVSTGVLNIALKFNVPMLPSWTEEYENHKYRVRIGEEIVFQKTGTKQECIEKNLLIMNQIIEKQIKKYPYQWLEWRYDRWKDQP